MNWKKIFIHGVVSGMFSSLACIIYNQIYSTAFYVDFSRVAGTTNFIAASLVSCMLMALAYQFIIWWKGEKMLGGLNILFSILSFASIISVLGFNLPLDIEFPEMFPGLVIPMHFFPVLSILTIYPFIQK